LPKENQFLDDEDPNKFVAKMGAEALFQILSKLDLDDLSFTLRHKANTETSQQRKNEALKRLQVVEAFRASKNINRPEWMIVRCSGYSTRLAAIGATGWRTFCNIRFERPLP
jgi:DNA-directed RNA polymerase subunit beta'